MPEGGGKVCTACSEWKPLEDYYRQSSAPDGRQWTCKLCTSRKQADKHRENPELRKVVTDRHYYRHREKILAKAKKWREDNLERARARDSAYQAKYRRERPWVFAERYQKNREVDLARQADYRARNPEYHRARSSARRAALAGAKVVPFTAAQLKCRLSMFGGKCWICGDEVTHATSAIDHVKPLAKGGLHVLSNLRLSCRLCNARKRDTWPFSPESAWWVESKGGTCDGT